MLLKAIKELTPTKLLIWVLLMGIGYGFKYFQGYVKKKDAQDQQTGKRIITVTSEKEAVLLTTIKELRADIVVLKKENEHLTVKIDTMNLRWNNYLLSRLAVQEKINRRQERAEKNLESVTSETQNVISTIKKDPK